MEKEGRAAKMETKKTNSVIVDSSDYEISHGHTPRGRGGWLFCTVDPRRNGDYLSHLLPNFNGTYKEAKGAAIENAKKRGLRVIWTCA